MKIYKKMIICSMLVLFTLCFMAGCKAIKTNVVSTAESRQQKTSNNNNSPLSEKDINIIKHSKGMEIMQDTPCVHLCEPKDQEHTLVQVVSWLQKSKIYNGKIPNSKNSVMNAYSGPSILEINSDNNNIIIEPAFYLDDNAKYQYIQNIVLVEINKKKTYIESKDMYEWLKNDQWKSEFKHQ